MTDKALQQGGQVVRVTVNDLQGSPKSELFDVAVPDPRSAERAVSESIKAIAERIEAVEPLSQSAIDRLGLKPGEIRKRP
jgi:hypothetical protein